MLHIINMYVFKSRLRSKNVDYGSIIQPVGCDAAGLCMDERDWSDIMGCASALLLLSGRLLQFDTRRVVPTLRRRGKKIVKFACRPRFRHHIGYSFAPFVVVCCLLVRHGSLVGVFVDLYQYKLRGIILVLQDIKPSDTFFLGRIARVLERGLFESFFRTRFNFDKDVDFVVKKIDQ